MNMNISEMKANEDALAKETATAAYNLKISLFRTRNSTPIFSKTTIDRAKRFEPKKTTFQGKQLG